METPVTVGRTRWWPSSLAYLRPSKEEPERIEKFLNDSDPAAKAAIEG